MPNLNPRREDVRPSADAVEVRPAEQHLVAQVDGRLKQHRMVPDPPQPVPKVNRLHRRSLIVPAKDAPDGGAECSRGGGRCCGAAGRHDSCRGRLLLP